ncbi:MAG: sigma-54 dependent transcriptional regulator, partial [Myxococcales bacterium]|nr:sigma-54 dependent transcriptional regulator [Myxococcales bacterium]
MDDDEGYARVLMRSLQRDGFDVSHCQSGGQARSAFEEALPDVVVLDYQLPDIDGLELLDELRPRAPAAAFLMATAFPDLDVAVEAMRRGAFDYVAKGAQLRECLIRIERAAEVARLRSQMAEASAGSGDGPGGGLIGESQPMIDLRSRLDALAKADDTTALITGETGTGKGVVARWIHTHSGRAYEPFVAVDCTTIPVTLVESELFGHEKGAFSGAAGTKQGRVEAAGRGTLFLDEIGELELPVQAKLLRLLEEREFTRVGSTKPRHVHARIIAATNRDLEREVAEGRFRADLRYRLEVFLVRAPALRERGDDILLIAAHFIRERARVMGRSEPILEDAVIEALRAYPFPGNVRELRNMVEQAMLLGKGEELELKDFPVLARESSGSLRSAPSAIPPPPGAARPEPVEGAPAPPFSAAAPSLALAPPPLAEAPAPRAAPEAASASL